VPALARDCYESLFHVPPGNGRPAKRSLILNSDGGSTLYIGSRVSDRFARLYDKGIEQGTTAAGKWWRLELELKGRRSQSHAEALLSTAAHRDQCLATVAEYFQQKAMLVIPFESSMLIYNESRAPTSDARRLHWLSSQVRGTILELTRTVGLPRVLCALGIPQSAVRDL
jgi:DNA relaxase NicK